MRRGACAVVVAIGVIAGGRVWAQGTGSGTGSGSGSGSTTTGSGAAAGTVIQVPMDAQAPEVTASASPSQLVLGQRFTLFVTAVFDAGVEVNLREPMDLGSAFEVTRHVSSDKPRADGKRVREWQIEVFAWDLGDLEVPPVAVTFTVGGRAGQVMTNAVPVHVSGVLGDVDDPKLVRADAPPVRLVGRDWKWLWIGGAAVLAIVVVWLVLWLRRRRRYVPVAAVPGQVAPRRVDMTGARALEQLTAIERSGVLDRDDDRKRGYLEMIEIVREYLGARYRIATPDLTTAELVRALAKTAPEEARAQVDAWLERCDLVRYGGFRASAGEAAAVLADARTLVVDTTPPDERGERGEEAA